MATLARRHLSTNSGSNLANRAKPARPFLKWAGGKRQLLEAYEPHFPVKYNVYIEPFLGGGAVFFHLAPRAAVLSDANRDLIDTYRAVKNHVARLISDLTNHRNEEEHYYSVRSTDPDELTKVERAARFIFLNRTCFNGLYRVNRQGHFNVPFGSYIRPKIVDETNLRAASRALRGTALKCGDFEQSMKLALRGDFIYLDPPYDPITSTASFTSYHHQPFGEDEQMRLANAYRRSDQRGCLLMLSNSDTPLVRKLYKGYSLIPFKARRAINSKPNGRGPVNEVLITNYRQGGT